MIANLIGGLIMIAAGLFPLYFGLSNWWWILGGAMILFGAVVAYSGCRTSCLLGKAPNISDEEIKRLKETKDE